MEITNRSLIVLLVATVALVGIAAWLSTNTLVPAEPEVVEPLTPAIVEQAPNVLHMGTRTWTPSGPVTVNAEDGRAVRLICDGIKFETLPVDGVANFETTALNGCQLFLDEDGKPFEPIYPGDTVTCALDQLTDPPVTTCEGSLADVHSATITAWSRAHGTLKIDGELVGNVPIEGLRLRMGKHKLLFEGDTARSEYELKVGADEHIELYFHSDARAGANPPPRPANAVYEPPATPPPHPAAPTAP